MTETVKWALIAVVAFGVVSGQALMSLWSRRVPDTRAVTELALFAAASPLTYFILFSYGFASVCYLVLLRHFPLAQVTLTVLAFMMCMTAAYTIVLGQGMNPAQWIGAILTAIGIILMQAN